MKFNKGDRVKFLNDTGGGIITGISGKNMAIVLIEDGFEVPVPLKELIMTVPSAAGESGESDSVRDAGEQIEEDVPVPLEEFEEEHIPEHPEYSGDENECSLFAGIVGSSGDSGKNDLYLVNDSFYRLLYTVLLKDEEDYLNIKTGMLEEGMKIHIHSFTRDEINEHPVIKFQVIFYRKGIYEPKSPVQREIELDPADVYSTESFAVNDYFEEDAFMIPVYVEALEKSATYLSAGEIDELTAVKEESSEENRKRTKKKSQGDIEEVDLHIEELVDDHRGMSNAEILEVQLARFTTSLEGALKSGTRRIVFIHGVGNGRLKFKIRQTLDRKYPRLRYQDASFKEYGYGATMVITGK